MKLRFSLQGEPVEGWQDVNVVETGLREKLPWHGVTHVLLDHYLDYLRLGKAGNFLRELRKTMALGGQLMVVGPDMNRAQVMSERWQLGADLDMERLKVERQWWCTPMLLGVMLRQAGWTTIISADVDRVPAMWPVNDRVSQWQCAVAARRGR